MEAATVKAIHALSVFLLNISLISCDVNKQTAGEASVHYSLSLFICLFLIEVSAASLWKFVSTH